MFFKALYHISERVFQFYATGVGKISFWKVPDFCDQVAAKVVNESDTGIRSLEISLDTVREICTRRFYIVGSVEFR